MWTVTQMQKTSMMTITMILWIITKPRTITTNIMIEVWVEKMSDYNSFYSEKTNNDVPEGTYEVTDRSAADVSSISPGTQISNHDAPAPQPDISPVLQQPNVSDSTGVSAPSEPLTTRKKVLVIVLITLGLVLLGVIIYASVFTPEKEYKRAVDCIVAGDYERAERMLEPLSQKNYAQSSEYLRFCRDLQKMKKGERIYDVEYDLNGEYMPKGILELYEKLILYEICFDKEYIYYNSNSFEERDNDLYSDEIPDDGTAADETTTQWQEDSESDSIGGYGRGYGGNLPYADDEGDDTGNDDYGGSDNETTKAYDPYHADAYYDAEDFYDDHYDDFMDYYEAEDYYNEHHDWGDSNRILHSP